MKVAFVVLHYENVADTKNCIATILNLKEANVEYKIYLLDNASPNQSGDLLEKMYRSNKKIEVIKLPENYGFSKANNIGYLKAKEWQANVVAVLNNDILIEDTKFLAKLKKIYMKEKEHLAVVAPDIINAQGHHQNPLRENAMTLKGAYKNLIYNRCLLIAFKIPVLNKFLYQIDKKRSEKWFDNYYRSQKVEYREDIVPHGAFVIYFPKWIQEENQAFPCHTFMYLEEDFLKSYCDKKNYLIKYIPELKVKHLEGRSVANINRKEFLSYQFKLQRVTKSLKLYIRSLKESR